MNVMIFTVDLKYGNLDGRISLNVKFGDDVASDYLTMQQHSSAHDKSRNSCLKMRCLAMLIGNRVMSVQSTYSWDLCCGGAGPAYDEEKASAA